MTRATDIYKFLDFREFLKALYLEMKAKDNKYSQRYFANKFGVKSSGFFSDILKGKRNLSTKNIIQVTTGLKLNTEESEYFENLVRFNQADSVEDKKYWLKKIMMCKNIDVKLLNKNSYEYFSHWYHTVIRELLFFFNFNGDYGKLASSLIPSITVDQAKESIKLLTKLGFIEKDKSGEYIQKNTILHTGETVRSIEVAEFQLRMMEHATKVFDKIPGQERNVSTLTLSLSKKGFADVNQILLKTKNEILKIANGDCKEDRVYQVNLQYFPLTKKNIVNSVTSLKPMDRKK